MTTNGIVYYLRRLLPNIRTERLCVKRQHTLVIGDRCAMRYAARQGIALGGIGEHELQ